MTGDRERLPVAISLVALLLAVATTVAGSHDSSATFVVTSESPGNQIVTLDPQPPATFSVPVSRPAGAVELAWTASSTAALRSETTYSVHRSAAGAATYTAVATGLTGLTYTDTPGADGSYDYKIRTDISSFSADSVARAGLSDRVAPAISGVAAPPAILNGWRGENVTVTFSCSDTGGSGIASWTSPATLTTEGANQSSGGSAADIAGNTSSTTVTSIGIDKSAPTAATGLASASGDFLGPTTVELSWTAGTDTMSGVDGYTLRWVAAVLSCPAAGPTNYPNTIALGSVTTHSFTGDAATSYCFYLVTTDRVGWVSPNSSLTGPTLAR